MESQKLVVGNEHESIPWNLLRMNAFDSPPVGNHSLVIEKRIKYLIWKVPDEHPFVVSLFYTATSSPLLYSPYLSSINFASLTPC